VRIVRGVFRRTTLDRRRRAHAVPLDQQQVETHQKRRDCGEDRHVKPEQPGQRRAGDVLSAAHEANDELADAGHAGRDVGADPRGEK
jgi:hypothetical protein